MATWQHPVFDRTLDDVRFAEQQIREWKEQSLRGEPVDTYNLKGCLNVIDLNRIEGDIEYLDALLREYGYYPTVSCREWGTNDVPTEGDVKRILSSVRSILAEYHLPEGASYDLYEMRTYEEVNAVERALYGVERLIEHMIGSFQKSGGFQSGAKRMLPVGR